MIISVVNFIASVLASRFATPLPSSPAKKKRNRTTNARGTRCSGGECSGRESADERARELGRTANCERTFDRVRLDELGAVGEEDVRDGVPRGDGGGEAQVDVRGGELVDVEPHVLLPRVLDQVLVWRIGHTVGLCWVGVCGRCASERLRLRERGGGVLSRTHFRTCPCPCRS